MIFKNWPRFKKLWSLFLISAYACVFSFGENNWGASWTLISEDTGVSLTNMNGGSALNYLLLGFFNIIWIPTAMKLGRKIVYILSLVILLGGSVWGGFYHGTAQYYIMLAIQGIGTAAYQALIQLTVIITSVESEFELIIYRSLICSLLMSVAVWLLSTSSSNSWALSWD
jgi:MFS family permease